MEERTKIRQRIFLMATSLLTLGIVIFGVIIVLYAVSSGKVKTEFVQTSEAAEFYEQKFEDVHVALKAQRDSTRISRAREARLIRNRDSIIIVADIQRRQIEKLEKQNKALTDSLSKRKYQSGTLN